jgi:hypothetical protein
LGKAWCAVGGRNGNAKFLFSPPSAGSIRKPDRPRRSPQVPKRTDIHKIMVIGSGPIVIGQAAE